MRAALDASSVSVAELAALGIQTRFGGERMHYRLTIRPAAWKLTQRRTSRIFQRKTVVDVIDEVLAEHGVAWRWAAVSDAAVRDYVVQYEESDWELVTRLLAEAGWFFFFEVDPRGLDRLVIAGSAEGYVERAPGDAAVICLPFRDEGSGALHTGEAVVTLALHERLAPTQAVVRGYDFRQPMRTIHHEARDRASAEQGDAGRLEQFFHHVHFEDALENQVAELAAVQLEQHRSEAAVAMGTTTCPRLQPGHLLGVSDHSLPELNCTWAVISVEHHHRVAPGDDEPTSYRNDIECVAAEVAFRPPVGERKVVQVLETATVQGPEGSQIHTDELGRVLVRFHWDRRSLSVDHSTCWVRTVHQWTGSHWGQQHIPRVGAEVAVSFLGGDPDRPVIVGELRNVLSPPPFPLPEHKTRSGWRTQSVPAGGFHELSFEDAQGREEIFLRSQGHLREEVSDNHLTTVAGNRHSQVAGTTEGRFDGAVDLALGSNVVTAIRGNRTTRIDGNSELLIQGSSERVVQGHAEHVVQGNLRAVLGGSGDVRLKERSRLVLEGDAVVESAGCLSAFVGTPTAPRSLSLDAEGVTMLRGSRGVEIRSDSDIVLSVGKSSLRLTAGGIVLDAPDIQLQTASSIVKIDDGVAIAADTSLSLTGGQVVASSRQGASLGLTAEASLDGAQVLLNSAIEAECPVELAPAPNTTLALKRPDGTAAAHRPYVIETASGARRSGRLDDTGMATFHLEERARVAFPGVWFEDAPPPIETGYRLHVVRPGEDLDTLSILYGVPSEQLWKHPRNAELAERRVDPYVLCPGDRLVVPICEPHQHEVVPDTENAFVGDVAVAPIEVTLLVDGKPLANHRCIVWGLGDPRHETTDGSGVLRFEDTDAAIITVEPEGHQAMDFVIGDLDPVTTTRGIQSRLQNLGYLHQAPTGVIDAATTAAIAAFCADHAVSFERFPDESFLTALEQAFGR